MKKNDSFCAWGLASVDAMGTTLPQQACPSGGGRAVLRGWPRSLYVSCRISLKTSAWWGRSRHMKFLVTALKNVATQCTSDATDRGSSVAHY